MLIDRYGRVHTKLRVSVTDRCNLRCRYCMPLHVRFLPRPEVLTFEEIERFVRIAASLGIRRVRLTGGEPTLRRDLPELVRRLVRIDGIESVSMTTNAMLLDRLAGPLRRAGLQSLNISLDTLDAEAFNHLVRDPRGRAFDRVLAGLRAARAAGFAPLKLNAVALRGTTEEQLVRFAHFAREQDVEVRFIEFMPLDGDGAWNRADVLRGEEIIERIGREVVPLEPVEAVGEERSAPARRYRFVDGRGTIGIIPTVTAPFCASCNRVRISADGKFRSCLFATTSLDVRAALRRGDSDREIAAALCRWVEQKWKGHRIGDAEFRRPDEAMYAIGG